MKEEKIFMAKLTSYNIELKLPYIGGISGTWVPDESERKAAWEMYVELVTRISCSELIPDDGLLRESLSSLYSLFETTRTILRSYGPSIAQLKPESNLSFGLIAVMVLNAVLRPVLSKWHPCLLDYENTKQAGISSVEHEQKWERSQELRNVINETRLTLIEYANVLATIAQVPSLISSSPGE